MKRATDGAPESGRWRRRIGWLLLLWSAGVATAGLVAALLRAAFRFVWQ